MLNPDGSLDGHVYFHLSDDSSFHAAPLMPNGTLGTP